jgi:hypothetical protein
MTVTPLPRRGPSASARAIAVAQQLEVLPRREEQRHDEEARRRAERPHLPVPLAIDLADDRVVAKSFLIAYSKVSPSCSVSARAAWRSAPAVALDFRSPAPAAASSAPAADLAGLRSRAACASRCDPRANET